MFSITKNWVPLDTSLYTRDEKTKTLSTNENWLVLDFRDYSYCTFDTGFNCTFDTGSDCTFKTCHNCTFDTGYNCTFKTGYGCVVVRRDIYEVIELKEWQKIKLNGYGVKWYTIIAEKPIQKLTVKEICDKLWYEVEIVK